MKGLANAAMIAQAPAENERLRARVEQLEEALRIACECGSPEKLSMYDEEGIEGWVWTHPDGREWTEMGDWSDEAPMHPVARAALSDGGGE